MGPVQGMELDRYHSEVGLDPLGHHRARLVTERWRDSAWGGNGR